MIEGWQLILWLTFIVVAIITSGVLLYRAQQRRRRIRERLNRPLDEIGLQP